MRQIASDIIKAIAVDYASEDKLVAAVVEAIQKNKSDVIGFVEFFNERAAIRQYDGGQPREEAERQAWVDLLAIIMTGL